MKLSKNKAATVRRSMRGLTETEKDSGFANYVFDGKQFLVSPLYSELENKDRGHLRMAGSETDESRTLCKDWDVYHDSKIREKIIKAIEPLLSFEVHALWQGKKPAFMVARDFNRAKGRRRIVDMICADLNTWPLFWNKWRAVGLSKVWTPQVPDRDMVPRSSKSSRVSKSLGIGRDSYEGRMLQEFNKEALTANEAAARVLPDGNAESCRKRVTELQAKGLIEDSGEKRKKSIVWLITDLGRKLLA